MPIEFEEVTTLNATDSALEIAATGALQGMVHTSYPCVTATSASMV